MCPVFPQWQHVISPNLHVRRSWFSPQLEQVPQDAAGAPIPTLFINNCSSQSGFLPVEQLFKAMYFIASDLAVQSTFNPLDISHLLQEFIKQFHSTAVENLGMVHSTSPRAVAQQQSLRPFELRPRNIKRGM
ncbi:Hypothetical predicted protein [Podarcis lilfordi]|uniref:Uncharacterized protein n=1 Tax=Podarcis lilfordi TaxID=74358 RepID=A0AA35PM14_9SAUR|nr:Hypothetical predicted protein [Podarcis lilfordi]